MEREKQIEKAMKRKFDGAALPLNFHWPRDVKIDVKMHADDNVNGYTNCDVTE